jgi:uncharacterized protein YdgA (DUF945 family)
MMEPTIITSSFELFFKYFDSAMNFSLNEIKNNQCKITSIRFTVKIQDPEGDPISTLSIILNQKGFRMIERVDIGSNHIKAAAFVFPERSIILRQNMNPSDHSSHRLFP